MKRSILLLLAALLAMPSLFADEGMWLPSLIAQRIPDMQSKGFRLTAEDIYSVNQASLKDAVVLFGSYDWGDGQWLRDWADRINAAGATVVNGEGLKNHLDEIEDSACQALGAL